MIMKTVAMAALLVTGCAAKTAPTSFTLVPDATFQDNAEAMDEIRDAASWWSAVGADIRIELSGSGTLLQAIPAGQWSHMPNVVGLEGADLDLSPGGPGLQINWSLFETLTPDDRRTALAHEFGHALGLWHVADSSAVMYASVNHPTGAITHADAVEYFSVH